MEAIMCYGGAGHFKQIIRKPHSMCVHALDVVFVPRSIVYMRNTPLSAPEFE